MATVVDVVIGALVVGVDVELDSSSPPRSEGTTRTRAATTKTVASTARRSFCRLEPCPPRTGTGLDTSLIKHQPRRS